MPFVPLHSPLQLLFYHSKWADNFFSTNLVSVCVFQVCHVLNLKKAGVVIDHLLPFFFVFCYQYGYVCFCVFIFYILYLAYNFTTKLVPIFLFLILKWGLLITIYCLHLLLLWPVKKSICQKNLNIIETEILLSRYFF